MMPEEELPLSKSEVKRQIKQIKDLGTALSHLSKGQLRNIPLSEDALVVVQHLQTITSNAAKKRQTQFLAKVLGRQENLADIEAAHENILGQTHQVDAQFHLAERWRDQLMEDASRYLTEFMSEYANVSSQDLRHLVRKAAKEKQLQANHGAYRALFRFIKQAIENA
tara:strand:+ start:211 stop:711 length:501 start_codon:yes stop_codon:yes gene_type:complete